MKTQEQLRAEATRHANTIAHAVICELFFVETMPLDDPRFRVLQRAIRNAYLVGAAAALEDGGVI